MNKNFEDFLRGKFAEQAEGVLDDDLPDAYEHWVDNLGYDEFITYADEFVNAIRKDLPEAKFPF